MNSRKRKVKDTDFGNNQMLRPKQSNIPRSRSLGHHLPAAGTAPPATLAPPVTGPPARSLSGSAVVPHLREPNPIYLDDGGPDEQTYILPPQTTTKHGDNNGIIPSPLSFNSVVKVLSTVQEPDFENPWQKLGVDKGNGSGVAFLFEEKPCILTAAHVVAHQTFVQVQRIGVETPDKFVATLYAIWHDCDLALLQVDDEDFWDGLQPAVLGDLPEIRSIVLVAGFPIGGGELSVTEGVVSRIEDQRYAHTQRRLLAITVDAAINPGNSGGPVFNTQGELVGIAFQTQEMATNIGQIIPPPVIRHFLDGVSEKGPDLYQGFPGMGFETQDLSLENRYMRDYLHLPEGVRGVFVTQVYYQQTCDGVVKPQDVVTHVAGHAVANNGTVTYGEYGRVDLSIIFSMTQVGTPIELRIIRKGKPMTVTVTTKPYQRLVPLQFHGKRPSYFVYCGLVFQPLSLDYLEFTGGTNPFHVTLFYNGRQSKEWKQAIVLSQVLSDKVNVGYESLCGEKIMRLNGERVVDLADLVHKMEACQEPTFRLETCCDQVIMLPSPYHPDAKQANERIIQNYAVGRDRYLDGD